MWTKIKNWVLKYLDLFVGGLVVIIAFVIGHIIKLPGPVNKGEARHFTTIDEFKSWYSSRFLGYWMLLYGDCDDRADYVRRCALHDGFILSFALIRDGSYYGVKVSSIMGGHCGILALCGNEFWYLEHNTGEFNKICNRD